MDRLVIFFSSLRSDLPIPVLTGSFLKLFSKDYKNRKTYEKFAFSDSVDFNPIKIEAITSIYSPKLIFPNLLSDFSLKKELL